VCSMCAREFSPSRPGLVMFWVRPGSPPLDWSKPLSRLVYTFAGSRSRDPADIVTQGETLLVSRTREVVRPCDAGNVCHEPGVVRPCDAGNVCHEPGADLPGGSGASSSEVPGRVARGCDSPGLPDQAEGQGASAGCPASPGQRDDVEILRAIDGLQEQLGGGPISASGREVMNGTGGSWVTDPALISGFAYELVGFRNFAVVSDLQSCGRAGDCHAARSYSWISPPRTLRRRIRSAARSVTGSVAMSPLPGGRRFLARCGRWRL